MKKPPFITPTCGHPSHREPLRIGEINYTAQQINELLSLIPYKADKKELFPNDSYLGHFPMGAQLPDMDRFAWAFVGDLDKAHPYFYYPKLNVPQGYQSGWNDMTKEFGTYLLTPGKQDQLTAEELFKEKFRLPELTADRAIADEQGNRITDTYVKREAVANHIKQIYNQQFLDNPPLITEGYITPEMLSEETKQMLENTGQEITNLPDGEDLQSVHGVLKLADKQYNPNSYSGLGRRILRKNIVAGVNVLTQSMMQWPNTIYVIQYDYDLQGETITIPENCVLQFEGGSLNNGSVVGNNTNIKSNSTVFYKTALKGSILNHVIESKWFDFTGEYENDTPIFLNLIDFPKPIHFSSGTYAVSLSENIMVNGCNLIGIGENSIRPVLKIKNANNHSRFLLGLSYNCGIQNMYLACYQDNILVDILRSDVYFGSTGVSHADRRIVLKDITIAYDRLWELPENERKSFYSTAIHFRHTDFNLYDPNDKISNTISEGFAFRGSDFDNIQIKNFHVGIKITTGYNTTKMWVNSIYFKNLEIWAGKGISFEHDENCINERPPYKVNVFSYMYQTVSDSNPDLLLNGHYRMAGFWGDVDKLLILNYDYWDTDCRGVVAGVIYQSNVAGIFNGNNAVTGGWYPLDSSNPPIVYDWRDMDGDSAVFSKATKTKNYRSVLRPEWDGFSIRPSVDFSDTYKNPTNLEEGVYGKLLRNAGGKYIESIFDIDPSSSYKKEEINASQALVQYAGELTLKVNGKELLLKPKRLDNVVNDVLESMEGVVYDKTTRQFYIVHNKILSDFRGSEKVMYNNYDAEAGFVDKFPNFAYTDLNKIFSIAGNPHIVSKTTDYSEGSSYGARRIETAPFGAWHKGNIRPSNLNENTDVGFFFFDTTLNKPIWWIGSKWVDATGAEV